MKTFRRPVYSKKISVQFSHSVVSYSLRPHGLQHARLPCLSPNPRACSNSCPLNRWCYPTISSFVIFFSSPPSIIPSIGVFSNKSVLHIRWTKYWSFSFSISPSNEYSRLILFTIDWFELLVFPGTFKNLLQHNNSKASVPQHSAFFMVQCSHPYMTTRKIIALIRYSCQQVMSLLFNMLSTLVIAFLLRSKCLLISAAVTICSDSGDQEIKACHCFHCFPIYLPWSDGTRCHDPSFLNVEF